ncbi:MAG: hypothetical protein ACOVOD_05245 [Rhodoferax sp.]
MAAPETIGNIRSQGDYLLMTHTAPDVGLPSTLKAPTGKYGKIVSEAWDYVQAIEILATYAADKIKPSKQYKPDQELARGLARFIACEFQNVTGSLPPDTRASWFAKFMALIASHYRIPCGPRIIRGAIADLRVGGTLIR